MDKLKELYEEARAFAVSELLAKHQEELKELHNKHFRFLVQRAKEFSETSLIIEKNRNAISSVTGVPPEYFKKD